MRCGYAVAAAVRLFACGVFVTLVFCSPLSCILFASSSLFLPFLFTWISYNFVASFIVAGLEASRERAKEMVRKLQGIAGTINDSLGGSHALFPFSLLHALVLPVKVCYKKHRNS